MQLQILIINNERSGRHCNGTIDRFKTLLEQVLIVIKSPPTFTIKGVRDVKLGPWITLSRVSTLPLVTRGAELLAPKERERSIKLLLIYLVSAGRNLSSGCHFLEAARFSRIYPDDCRGVNRGQRQPNDLNEPLLHVDKKNHPQITPITQILLSKSRSHFVGMALRDHSSWR